MSCDRYWELLSLELDGLLSGDETEELKEHLAVCPDCRAARSRLAALHSAFRELEEAETPEGFAQGVMERVRGEKKVIPLFRRSQFRALAGLAACLMVVVGLYSAGHSQRKVDEGMMLRGFSKGMVEGMEDVSACGSLSGDGDNPMVNAALAAPEPEEAPQIAAFTAPESTTCDGVRRAGGSGVEAADGLPAERLSDRAIMVLERMPEGAEELIDLEAAVTWNPATGEEGYRWPDDPNAPGEPEALAQIEQLAVEQEMCVERSSAPAEELLYDLVVLQPNR